MSVLAAIGWSLAAILIAISFWIGLRRRGATRRAAPPPRLVPSAAGQKPSEALVWIEPDGSARELTEAEKTYVDTEFSPFDGARPYIKSRYEQRNGSGEIKGFLHRRELPTQSPVKPAPPLSPPPASTPEAVASSIRELIQKHPSR